MRVLSAVEADTIGETPTALATGETWYQEVSLEYILYAQEISQGLTGIAKVGAARGSGDSVWRENGGGARHAVSLLKRREDGLRARRKRLLLLVVAGAGHERDLAGHGLQDEVVGVPHRLVAIRVRQVAGVEDGGDGGNFVAQDGLDHVAVISGLAVLAIVGRQLGLTEDGVGQRGARPGVDTGVHVHAKDLVVAVVVRGRANRRGRDEGQGVRRGRDIRRRQGEVAALVEVPRAGEQARERDVMELRGLVHIVA